jgi:hypothetical protein
MTYFVEGLTNVHSGESDVRHIGDFESLEEAIRASQDTIDRFLAANLRNGMTVADLFAQYQKFGEVPLIFSDGAKTMNVSGFNHFKYAMIRCAAICEPVKISMQRKFG